MFDIFLGLGKNDIGLIDSEERFKHCYIIGATGMGKSTLILNMIKQDLQSNVGIILIDPSGTLVEDIAGITPPDRELIYLSISHATGFNPLQKEGYHKFDVIDEFKDIVNAYITRTTSSGETTYLMNEILENALEVLLDIPEYANIKSLYEFLTFKAKRAEVFSKVEKPPYWEEFDSREKREKRESALRIASRLNPFIKDPRLFKITSGYNEISFKDIADNKKILLVDCSKMSRAKMLFFGNMIAQGIKSYFTYEEPESPLAFYVDEFQNFINEDFNKILAEGRKYQVAFTLAHQDHSQIPKKLLGSILGNVGTTCCFRVGADEAHTLSRHFREPYDLHNLEDFQCCVRIGIEEYQIDTLPPPKKLKENSLSKIKQAPSKPHTEPSEPKVYVSLWDGQPQFFTF